MSLVTIFVGNRSPSLTDTIRVDGVAFNLTGSTVKLRMRLETSATLKIDTAATIVTPASGTVRYDWAAVDVDTAGVYTAWWRVTLASGFIQESPPFTVRIEDLAAVTPATPDLCTVEDVRAYLQKTSSETAQDSVIQSFITAASREIANYCQRDLAPVASATYRFRVDGTLVDLDHDLRSASTVTLDPDGAATILTASSYSLLPIGASLLGTYSQLRLANTLNLTSSRAVLFGYTELSIAGAWGPVAVPADVEHAAIITAGLWIRREVAARGVLSPDVEVDAFDLQPRSIPGAALRALEPYRTLVVA